MNIKRYLKNIKEISDMDSIDLFYVQDFFKQHPTTIYRNNNVIIVPFQFSLIHINTLTDQFHVIELSRPISGPCIDGGDGIDGVDSIDVNRMDSLGNPSMSIPSQRFPSRKRETFDVIKSQIGHDQFDKYEKCELEVIEEANEEESISSISSFVSTMTSISSQSSLSTMLPLELESIEKDVKEE